MQILHFHAEKQKEAAQAREGGEQRHQKGKSQSDQSGDGKGFQSRTVNAVGSQALCGFLIGPEQEHKRQHAGQSERRGARRVRQQTEQNQKAPEAVEEQALPSAG